MPGVTDNELYARVKTLRAAGSTPKQIARALGVTPASIAPLVRQVATELASGPSGDPAVIGCWVSARWSNGLTLTHTPEEWSEVGDLEPMAVSAGLSVVLVAREHRHGKATVCTFLVDTYCLGVKNASQPKVMDPVELSRLRRLAFGSYADEPLAIPIDLAQDLVFGAVEYAKSLGFDPHPDFALASGHLGNWNPPSRIGFGYNGQPFFQQGPHDDPARVMRTLDKSVGKGNYRYMTVIG